jgi:catechol 2,3-dioxygenase-like lactoylglutathione lyase family enzyme
LTHDEKKGECPMSDQVNDEASPTVTGILLVTIPVSDIAGSARWYRDVLQLQYVREFRVGEAVFACGLVDLQAGYGVQLRSRDATPARPDLRGVHPVVLRVAGSAALDAVFARLQRDGFSPTRGEHSDGAWVEVLDPDGIVLRFMSDVPRGTTFIGYQFEDEAMVNVYDQPTIDGLAPR